MGSGSTAEAEIRSLEARLAEAASEHRDEIGRLRARIAMLERDEDWELERVRAKVAALEAQLQAVLRSSSWRLTEPIRGFAARHPAMIERVQALAGRRMAVRSALRALARRRGGREWPHTEPPIVAPPEVRRGLELRAIVPGRAAEPKLPGGGGRRAICVGHVMPYPPRAGNEYRVHRMLSWLAGQGWDVLVVVCPLPLEMPGPQQIAAAAAVYPNLLVLDRAGTLHHSLRSGAEMLAGLSGGARRDFAALLQEDARGEPGQARILDLLRTFCPDPLVDVLLHLQGSFKPHLLLAEYVFMTRAFALLDPGLMKAVDTHDVFSTKAGKVERYGVSDGLALSAAEEAGLLRRADLLIAIQEDEARELAELAPDRAVISVGVDFPVVDTARGAGERAQVLMVASGNPMNVKGLQDFLQFAWPIIRRHAPEAEFVVAGAVGAALDFIPDGVRVLGRVAEVGPLYAEARVVINPAIAGSGLKIKTVEALSRLRPVVCWPSGVEGVPARARAFCHIATDWFAFARQVTRLLHDPDGARAVAGAGDEIGQLFSPEAVYAPLAEALQDA